ncbi:hypothetical protein KGO95_01865 [Patescibacteria group bacterium]|nr:hypothetical protein [Patescibacteria group bacterium]
MNGDQRILTKQERLNPVPNKGEILLGYQWVTPFNDGIDYEGLTKAQAGPLIIESLNTIEKHRYLHAQARKNEKPVPPAILVPAYLCSLDVRELHEFCECTVRSFRAEFTDVYEKAHWWSEPRLVRKPWLSLHPVPECYRGPLGSVRKTLLSYWDKLDQKILSLTELNELLRIPSKNKAA